jgi:hypothetical protein
MFRRNYSNFEIPDQEELLELWLEIAHRGDRFAYTRGFK